MILGLAALAGALMGWGRGGGLGAIGRYPLTGTPFLTAALLLVVLARIPGVPPDAARVLQGLGYAVALAVLWRNRARPWTVPILAGLGLNAVVIALNGGHMPISPAALAAAEPALDRAAPSVLDPRHAFAGPGTRLGPFGDVVPLGVGQMGMVLSPGDILMVIGVAGFVQAQMMAPRKPTPM